MTIITIYALFGDDIRILAFSKDYDQYFFGITSATLLFFTFEIVIASIAKDDYLLRFYFWLDAMATISLISDIGWIWDRIVGNQDFSASNAQQASQLARAGRGARVGTRAGRIIRIIRLIRLIRVVKLYKHAHVALIDKNERSAKEKEKNEIHPVLVDVNVNEEVKGSDYSESAKNNDMSNTSKSKSIKSSISNSQQDLEELSEFRNDQIEKIVTPEDIKIPEESRVGKKLSDLTTKRVIILVLAMMFSFPIFQLATYKEENNSFEFGLRFIELFQDDPSGIPFDTAFNTYLTGHEDIRTPLISVYVQIGTYVKSWDSPDTSADDLRFTEADIASINNGDYVAIFDIRKNTKLSAGLSIGRTLFVCLVLASGALLFSKDANDLVIAPIEQMIQKVNRIALNPLEAAQEEENEALALEQAKVDELKSNGKKSKKKKEGPYETVILEQTIIKIGALLALGFGEAGAKIIADNMAHTGDVDPMIPGNKVMAIFGF